MVEARGFTLIEVLLSVTIISMMVGLSMPIFQSYQNRNEVELAAQNLAAALRRAQVYARSGSDDSQWGIQIQSNTVTLYKGAVFASRDTTYDETYTIPPTISVSGDATTVFAKLSGLPDAAGTTTLTSVSTDVRTVSINAKGMVSY